MKLLSGGSAMPCVAAAPLASIFHMLFLELRADAHQQYLLRVPHVVGPRSEVAARVGFRSRANFGVRNVGRSRPRIFSAPFALATLPPRRFLTMVIGRVFAAMGRAAGVSPVAG